jgi:anti-sigma regulatory factor (Ser/Thr protein kinase)
MQGNGTRSIGRRTRPGTPAAVLHFHVERERRAIGRFNDAIGRDLQPTVPGNALCALQIALDELLTNVVLHAEQATGSIEIEVNCTHASVEATIRYVAVEFDPTLWQPDFAAVTIASARIGGHGIQLVRSLMDEFRYAHENGVNVVTVCKRW